MSLIEMDFFFYSRWLLSSVFVARWGAWTTPCRPLRVKTSGCCLRMIISSGMSQVTHCMMISLSCLPQPSQLPDKWQHDMFEEHTAGPRRSDAEGSAKLLISNLDFGVSDSDLRVRSSTISSPYMHEDVLLTGDSSSPSGTVCRVRAIKRSVRPLWPVGSQ